MNLCLAGLVAAVRITSLLGMAMLRNTFVTSVARFTLLHSPGAMAPKNAQAFRAMLVIADENGNHLGVRAPACCPCLRPVHVVIVSCPSRKAFGSTRLLVPITSWFMHACRKVLWSTVSDHLRAPAHVAEGAAGYEQLVQVAAGMVHTNLYWTSDTCCARAHQHVWQEVLRCVSRWELLVQVAAGGMTDALIFAAPAESPTASKRRPFFSVRSSRADAGACAMAAHGSACKSGKCLTDMETSRTAAQML